ncbi:hypothetical protein J2752_000804 [Halarchaeum rubridurum]|uniref:DUF7993 domain-containing protein n=1 Tax=Halarchaeum rubridurum TaxID=489911 RepID=A0A830FJ76_9EURY|nr:hypothetical protein [Halarchaeum rubridurum]MBP1953923.1 hypothetical protein [Halarchaeum rubridurum]GGM55881.1 hypothetical protein GCM10009017_02640 [Halarchaeum rubridurum]
MVERALDDGTRIAQLLASELTGRETGPFADAAVTDADPDVEATPDGARAYDVTLGEARVASVFVLPERVRVEFAAGLDAAKRAADDADLRARPRATDPPALLVFVADGADAKRVLPVFRAAFDAAREG